jgi:lysozyme family protein
MNINDPLFQKYVRFVLSHEGGLSKDANDTAVSCAPFPGAYHTNKGVTYCTFTQLANQLGILPVTYDRFTRLTDQEIGKFIFWFYTSVSANRLPDVVGLAVTEAAWGSGSQKAIKQLQTALNDLGGTIQIDGIIGEETMQAVNNTGKTALYQQFWKVRIAFIDYLLTLSQYAQFKTGWHKRINDFLAAFPIPGSSPSMWFILPVILLAIKNR